MSASRFWLSQKWKVDQIGNPWLGVGVGLWWHLPGSLTLFKSVSKCSTQWASMSFFSISRVVWSDVRTGDLPTDFCLYTVRRPWWKDMMLLVSAVAWRSSSILSHSSSGRAFAELAASYAGTSPSFGHSSCLDTRGGLCAECQEAHLFQCHFHKISLCVCAAQIIIIIMNILGA